MESVNQNPEDQARAYFSGAFWSLPKAAAWVLWSRTQNASLLEMGTTSLFFEPGFAEAVEELRMAFARPIERGGIVVSGLPYDELSPHRGGRLDVPRLDWVDLHLTFGPASTGFDFRAGSPDGRHIQYWQMRIENGEQVQAAFPRLNGPIVTYTNSLPGRPTSRHLVEEEMKRRAAGGLLESTIASEARHLSKWLSTAHPGAAPMTPKSVRNAFAGLYRELRRGRPE